ncbi:GNAT family N-acetyltransferase [Sediminibacillus dalangtanensis]|uniref:GNAT family N-acetyltransferase n=1 Tax=Sediminibacillus dalangtanensis TaxID=2729421 RepID=A0ABX7VS94_9BACI|nr:GNAT family protein [Sediminibacillus dalangtanensis]QTM98859.1 GNAT family N-acetyltransferase [Sediminibacillus dalangtanensis]
MNLKGEMLFLRELKRKDWLDVHAYAALPESSSFQPWGPNTEEQSRQYVNQCMQEACVSPRHRYALAITLSGTGEMVGCCELKLRDVVNKTGELSYIVHPKYWGRGIASEASDLMVSYGFCQLGLHRIIATCDPRNKGSKRVLEKLGMKKEGLLRENIKPEMEWRDSLLFSILDSEWKKY